jgi:pyridoxal 5'-phosphate synthase pdxT subunit
MKVGVLALQGDVREHLRALDSVGVVGVEVRHESELADVGGLILPGGESTTIGKLLDRFGLLAPLKERAEHGMPIFGTCAGAILMANEILGPQDAPHRLAVIDISVARNAYGRQVDSFETDLSVEGLETPARVAFIRAPIIERVGSDVEVLASHEGKPVLVRQGKLLAATFHPEVAGEDRVHEMFVSWMEKST